MKIYISVVSHGHEKIIKQLGCLSVLSQHFNVIVKSNKKGDDFSESNFIWINREYNLGFGHNNNVIFSYCKNTLGMTDEDYFIVLNPDVYIDVASLKTLIDEMTMHDKKLAAINLFKDISKAEFDNSIRNFPTLSNFALSFFFKKNTSILEKEFINSIAEVDWAAGSFLAFSAQHYTQLRGFDESYFMYCEDIDICYRSNKANVPVTYYPHIEAIHLAQHANRKLLSLHFYWHVSSVLRFLLSKFGLTKIKSSI